MGSEVEFSFEDEGAALAAPDSLDRLNQHLADAIALKEAVDQLEDDLSAAKKQLNHLNTSVIPDMMAEIGMDECTQRGWKIKVAEFVSGSLPKDAEKRARAIQWLEANEGGDMIKSTLSVTFNKSQHNEALSLAGQIEQEGFAPSIESGVHPQTLAAFARERMKNGEEVDTEILGLFTGRVAKFTRTKG